MTCSRSLAPPIMSPPMKLRLYVCSSVVEVLTVATMRSRNPGANRSIWSMTAAVASPV
ncbi:Uncharacterised protein [Mycobacterium tuberculosis]|uniref:Uncharacterized protein n=1 Tax=Mycobacterium tuberculosis TaxID=1773 RepID=A0A654U7Z7_MYCTX|nr:Uncharacterised protein [Mycobacterium tuberculosis]CKT59423.1 Uncharacterised protein [Mycobacterium tuberculosis]COX91981.1 Uncharacterised protein [Mycobacterium tuberculosis]